MSENNKNEVGQQGGDEFDPMEETRTIIPARLTEEIVAVGHPRKTPPMPDLIVGRYKVCKKIGEGNMGTVWLCEDTVGKVQVAVKAVPLRQSGDPRTMTLVRDNFRIVQKLNHPNIGNAKSIEFDEETGSYFLVMEYIQGRTLGEVLKEFPNGMPLEEIVPIVRQVAAGLDYSHEKNTVHRDIKPSNIIIEEETGTPKILDFGIAGEFSTTLLHGEGAQIRDTTSQSGTPYFMAPEQWTGYKQDGRTDQYGLAATVYALLSGCPPFGYAATVESVMDCALNVAVEPLDNVDQRVWSVLEKAFSKDKANRYTSCTAFVDALEESLQPVRVLSTRSATVKRIWLAAASLVCGAIVAFPFVQQQLKKSSEAATAVAAPQTFGLPGDLHFHALVIGIDTYENGWPTLRNAVNDARSVSEVLQNTYGFSVTTLLNEEATQARITGELERITNRTVQDMVLIYFAGHGELYRQPEEGYWIPVDAMDKSKAPEAKSTWIWNSVITRYIEASSARHILVVADSCYAGSLFKSNLPNVTTVQQPAYRELLDRPSRHVLASGNYENVFDDSGKNHSPFALQFLNFLQDNQHPVFSVAELGNGIQQAYEASTQKTMRLAPLIRDTGGQFLFVRADTPKVGLLDALNQSLSPATLVSDRVYEGINLLSQRGYSNAAVRLTQKMEEAGAVDDLARLLAEQAGAEHRRLVAAETQHLIGQIQALREQQFTDPVFAEKQKQYAQPRIITVLGPRADIASDAQRNLAHTINLGLTRALQQQGTRVVERLMLNQILTEVNLDAADITDQRVASLVGKQLPATLLLGGDLVQRDENSLLVLRLVDTSTGEVLPMIEIEFAPEDQLKQRLDDLALQVLAVAQKERPLTARVIRTGEKYQALVGSFHGMAETYQLRLVERVVNENVLFADVRETPLGTATISYMGENLIDLVPTWTVEPPPVDLDQVWVVESAPAR